jgi:PAS domain S-box-containing protein
MKIPDYAPGVEPSELQTLWALSFEKTTHGIAIIEPGTRKVIAVNPAFAAMHGGTTADFVGEPIDKSLTAEGVARLPRLSSHLDGAGFISLESDHVRLDGSVIRVATEVIAAHDEDGKLLYRICWFTDLSEQVSIEKAFELRGEVIANMAEGVCLVTTSDMRVVYANPSLERMLGYEPGEINGRHALEVMRPPDLSAEEASERAAAESALRELGGSTYEGRRQRRDGSEIWCRTATTTFDHPRYGRVWVVVQRDITEERRARQAAADLERAKSEFLGSISHELRTPLTSILGYAAVLRADLPAGPQREQVEVIERNATRQLRLVEDLLNIARIEAGEFEFRHQPLDLSELVVGEVEALRPDAEAAGLEISVAAAGPLAVMGDADRLAQVVANLVSNSVKFTPAGGRIAVAVEVADGEALVSIDDSGPGIDPGELPYLFERLYRGEDVKVRQISGAGLGLAISRSIVEAHSGRIEAAASDLGGAHFEIALPAL